MNGAFAYKQVGEYDKAIDMYELFITYGNEKTSPSSRRATPPPPRRTRRYPKRYGERVKYLRDPTTRCRWVRALLQLPRRGRDVRQDQQQHALCTGRSAQRRASGPVAVCELGRPRGMTRARSVSRRWALRLRKSPRRTSSWLAPS